MSYGKMIEKLAPAYDPAHVEAWMRVEHGCLDGLSHAQFAREVQQACVNIDAGGVDMADRLAEMEGLKPRKREVSS